MIEVIQETKPIARKNYECNASDFLLEDCHYGDFTFSELRQIAKAKRNNFQIKKGQKYLKQVNKFEGKIYTFRAIPEIHKICLKHELYPEI